MARNNLVLFGVHHRCGKDARSVGCPAPFHDVLTEDAAHSREH